jgi:ethanolamine ammonia-lyase large subunit
MSYAITIGPRRYQFDDLKPCWPAPRRCVRATSWPGWRPAAPSGGRHKCAGRCRSHLSEELLIPCEQDEVSRLIIDSHDAHAFAPIRHLTVGGLRDWLLSDAASSNTLAAVAPGLTPEMAAVSKLMRNQDLIWWPANAG